MDIAALIIGLVEIAAYVAPQIVDEIRNKKYGLTPGVLTTIVSKILTGAQAKGMVAVNKISDQLNELISQYYPNGSAYFSKYIADAKRKAAEKLEQVKAASVEQEVYSNAAENLVNAYESLTSKSKKSDAGKYMRKEIEANTNKALKAAQKLDPTISDDTTEIKSIGTKEARNNIYGIEKGVSN